MIDFLNDIENCLDVLQQGGIFLYPTDTIWGIGCDATNAIAVNKIYQLKKRAEEKSMIVLLADEKDIIHYVTQPDFIVLEYLRHATKPTTVIYDGATGLAENVISKDGTVAIRVTRDAFCKHLIKRYKKPIVSTSANISGREAPAIFSSISSEIKNGVEYIVQHRQYEVLPAVPSAIIRCNKDGTIAVIRP